jgi:hypothetical protein
MDTDDNGGFFENPSSIMVATGMESDNFGKAGITAKDLLRNEDMEPSDTVIGKRKEKKSLGGQRRKVGAL